MLFMKLLPKMFQSTILFLLILLFMMVSAEPAFAYLDPGSGSYLVQIIIAGLVGVGFFVKSFWVTIKNVIGKLIKKFPKSEDEEN